MPIAKRQLSDSELARDSGYSDGERRQQLAASLKSGALTRDLRCLAEPDGC